MSTNKSIKPIDQLKHPKLKGQFACTTCPRVFMHRASLNKHRPQCSKQHTCILCNNQVGNIDALREHMKINHGMSNIYICECCAFTFENKKMRNEHQEQLSSTGTTEKSKFIATAGYLPGALLPNKAQISPEEKSGSLSPCTSSSSSKDSSTCPTPIGSPKEILAPEVSGEASEEPMNEFQKLTSEIIGRMLDNGWYSDEQLVLPETWEKMVGDAQKMAQKEFKKTARRGKKRARVE